MLAVVDGVRIECVNLCRKMRKYQIGEESVVCTDVEVCMVSWIRRLFAKNLCCGVFETFSLPVCSLMSEVVKIGFDQDARK